MRRRPTVLIAVAGLAAAMPVARARAQDSVSPSGGLPGDALDAYRTASPSFQVRDYVVDLAPIQSSWGHRYAIGPVAKSSRSTSTSPAYFNHLIAAQAASDRFGYGPFVRPSFQAWAAAGQGANPLVNTTPSDNGTGRFGTLNTATQYATRFGAAFMEFAGGPDAVFGNGDDENSIISTLVSFQTRRLDRLYVSRIIGLTNKSAATTGNTATAAMGLGSVDDDGDVHILADGQGLLTAARLQNKNLVRIVSLLRDPTRVNFIQQSGAATANDGPATNVVLETPALSATTLSTPTMIPRSIAGRPVMVAADFGSNLVYEPAPGATSSTRAHLSSPTGSARGNVSYTAGIFAPLASGGDTGTAALLSRTNAGTLTRGLTIFTLKMDGSVDQEREVQLPTASATIVDPVDGYDPAVAFPLLGGHEFTSYQSQVAFRGGNGQVSLTVLPGGDLLAAALVTSSGAGDAVPQGQHGYIAVVRISAATGVASWTVAAHTGTPAGAAGGQSKAILGDFGADGVPGTGDLGEGDGVVDATPIGRIALRTEVFPSSTGGPSISAPAMDRAGNLYFLATVALNTSGGPLANKTVALLRGNYDQATGGYKVEVLAKQGDVVAGPNSQRNYQIQFMGLADSDSADSGAVWSGNIVQDLVPGASALGVGYADPAALGAIVLRAKLVYDANSDGQYVDPSGPGGAGPDETYNAMLTVMPFFKPGDFNRDGVVNPADVAVFVNRWFADLNTGGTLADWDANGTVQPADIAAFINDWFASL